MTIKDLNFYNLASSKQLGWLPSWLNCDDFDEKLIQAIKDFQTSNNLNPDGALGPETFKKLYTETQAKQELFLNKIMGKFISTDKKYIYCNGKPIEIAWSNVITFKDGEGLQASPTTYRIYNSERKPKLFVIHWDATLNSKSCFDILEKRHLSVQFSIDNDGKIWQFSDCNNICQHAGANEYGSWNAESIGVEISNAVELKYQKYYEIKGFGSRPLWKNIKVHQKYLGTILGFYPIQLQALEKLLKCICNHYSIPFQCPVDETNNNYLTEVFEPIVKHQWTGVCTHLNLTQEKIDTAGLNLVSLLENIKNN